MHITVHMYELHVLLGGELAIFYEWQYRQRSSPPLRHPLGLR